MATAATKVRAMGKMNFLYALKKKRGKTAKGAQAKYPKNCQPVKFREREGSKTSENGMEISNRSSIANQLKLGNTEKTR